MCIVWRSVSYLSSYISFFFLFFFFFFRFVSWIMEHVKLEIEKKVNGDGGSTDCRIVMEWWRWCCWRNNGFGREIVGSWSRLRDEGAIVLGLAEEAVKWRVTGVCVCVRVRVSNNQRHETEMKRRFVTRVARYNDVVIRKLDAVWLRKEPS